MMSVKSRLGILIASLIVVSAAVGVSAYTTGELTRSSNVNVVSDDVGLIALEDGNSGGLVAQNTSGAMEIDFTNANANGVNTAAAYELGDPTDPQNHTAFNITNLDTGQRDITLEYTGSDSQDTDANLQFQVYDSTGTQVATVSEESGTVTVTGVGSGSTLYVVIVANTHGLDSTADLSGTLKVSA